MPIDARLILAQNPVKPPDVPNVLGTLADVGTIQRQRQQLTLGELGLAQQQRQEQHQQAAGQALQGAVRPDGTVDYARATGALARAGNLPGLAILAKTQEQLGQGEAHQAQAEQRRLEAHRVGTDMVHAAMTAVLQNPSLYPQVLEQLGQQFAQMGLAENKRGLDQFAAQHPVFDPQVVQAVVATTQNEKLRLQQLQAGRLGTTPIPGYDAEGNPAVAQLDPQGGLRVAQAPGFTPAPTTPRPLDVGTGYQPIGRGGQPAGPVIPKDVAGAAAEQQVGKAAGERLGAEPVKARATYDDIRALEVQHKTMLRHIEKAHMLAGKFGATGRSRGVLPEVLNTARANLEAELTSLSANLGIDQLEDMKARGSTLTPVTDTDLRVITGMIESLRPEQDADKLQEQLKTLAKEVQARIDLRKERFQRDYGHLVDPKTGRILGPPTVPRPAGPRVQTPHANKAPEEMTPAERDEEIRALEQHLRGR